METNPLTDVLIKEGTLNIDTDRERTPRDRGGRGWSDASIIQGAPRVAGRLWKLGERHSTDSPSEPPDGASTGCKTSKPGTIWS